MSNVEAATPHAEDELVDGPSDGRRTGLFILEASIKAKEVNAHGLRREGGDGGGEGPGGDKKPKAKGGGAAPSGG